MSRIVLTLVTGTCVFIGVLDADCPSNLFAIDTTGSNRSIAAEKGEAPGQTFFAEDTVIASITVWRRAEQSVNRSDMKLWIVEVDTTGRPQYNRIVFNGPVVRVMYGDGVHPVEIRYDLDPPAVLPYRGEFGFFVQNLCEWFFDLLVRDGTTYGEGEAWRSEIAIFQAGCPLRGISDRFDHIDLACKIEYCVDTATPARRETWGRLRLRYQ